MKSWLMVFSLLNSCLGGVSAHAQAVDTLPKWTADKSDTEQLGDAFKDERIQFRPPKDLQKIERENSPELTKQGVYSYAWAPGGVFPSPENLSITLTPYAQPSASALDKTVEGMQASIGKGLEDVKFGEVKKGVFGDFEARAGEYTAKLNGEELFAVYLVCIDKQGSFSLVAMMPAMKATDERVKMLQASLLTFSRAKSE